MHKDEFLRQVVDALTNNIDIEKVKITYTNGEVMKIAFDEIDGDDNDDEDEDDDDEDEDEDEDDEEETE